MTQWEVTLNLLAFKSHVKVTIILSPGSFDKTFGCRGNSKCGSILLLQKKETIWAAALLEMVQKSSWRAARQKM